MSDERVAGITRPAVERTLAVVRRQHLAARTPAGPWRGHLSSSALSTATAAFALTLYRRSGLGSAADERAAARGFAWLAAHQNQDGSWGDTVASPGNISTTTLCWAALEAASAPAARQRSAIERARAWLRERAGDVDARHLAAAIRGVYGKDKTFAVPILTHCALSGRFGEGRTAWGEIPALPFELAALPRDWLSRVGLGVVSYALPALIAIGLARHHHRPSRNLVLRAVRRLARARVLRVLHSIQPPSGGFLEAAPLTSFVLMSLVSIGERGSPAVRAAAEFLSATVREDGSWPIDTDLATWVTTLSIDALRPSAGDGSGLDAASRNTLADWLIGQQHRSIHPYTRAAPGGWAWTDRSGGVPDADDTAGALLALRALQVAGLEGAARCADLTRAVADGACWLVDLQNRDGGVPTFCRGWGKLPFDRSSPDLTAHAVRAWHAWRDDLPLERRARLDRALRDAVRYLCTVQQEGGSWIPLWFGSQQGRDQSNPLYGTARVVRIGPSVGIEGPLAGSWERAWRRGLDWIVAAQAGDGGWGAAAGVNASVEETALAVEALAFAAGDRMLAEATRARLLDSMRRGCAWLVRRTDSGRRLDAAPIGLYFARLWYDERLYPVAFTTAALGRALRVWPNEGAE